MESSTLPGEASTGDEVADRSVGRPAVAWLLNGDPAVRELARQDLLGEQSSSTTALESPLVQGLLTYTPSDGAPRHPYAKWTGSHWRLVSLVELGIPAGTTPALAAADEVLTHWSTSRHLAGVRIIHGRARRCASQEGNAVAVACRLGLADDSRVRAMVERLVSWQWPDGGWNCDRHPTATHSSFNETLPALWGLHEYAAATGDPSCRPAIEAAAELLLAHHVVFSTRTGAPAHPSFVELHYPPYWHYDVLQALVVLHRAGFGADPRIERARRVVADQRRANGTWRAGRRKWWRRPGSVGAGVEAVDWGEAANQMVTLNALRVGADRE